MYCGSTAQVITLSYTNLVTDGSMAGLLLTTYGQASRTAGSESSVVASTTAPTPTSSMPSVVSRLPTVAKTATTSPSKSHALSTGSIVGVVIAAFFVLTILSLLLFWFCFRPWYSTKRLINNAGGLSDKATPHSVSASKSHHSSSHEAMETPDPTIASFGCVSSTEDIIPSGTSAQHSQPWSSHNYDSQLETSFPAGNSDPVSPSQPRYQPYSYTSNPPSELPSPIPELCSQQLNQKESLPTHRSIIETEQERAGVTAHHTSLPHHQLWSSSQTYAPELDSSSSSSPEHNNHADDLTTPIQSTQTPHNHTSHPPSELPPPIPELYSPQMNQKQSLPTHRSVIETEQERIRCQQQPGAGGNRGSYLSAEMAMAGGWVDGGDGCGVSDWCEGAKGERGE
ncbi:MAG: hypothetical protein M1827_004390 [Pycnora praestabilis]|nr:MAG: hypothetical protein M1827_004390 [Pycnora praestabilis]